MKDTFASRAWRVVCAAALGIGIALVLRLYVGSAQVTEPLPRSPHVETSRATALALTHETYTIHVPLMFRCLNTRVAPFAIQFPGSLTPSQGLTRAVEAGTRWVRMPCWWTSIEPSNTTPEHYDWSGLDVSVTNAAQQDIELILTLAGQPSWAAVYEQGPVTNTADLVEFVGALVERYDGDGVDDAPGSPRVRYFELYNEPDNADVGHAESGGWGYWGHNGAGYAELLQTLHPVIHAANPRASLVLGGLALDWFEEQGGPFDSQFLDDVLAACRGQDCFDVMNFHYYPLFRHRWESYGAGIIGKTNYVQQELAAYGFTDMPVVCTETSWAGDADWGSDELQSRYVVKGYVRGMAAGLKTIVWYRITDQGDSTLPGLLDSDLQPKPSYWAFQTMTDMLGEEASYQRPLTSAETGHEQLTGYVFYTCQGRLDVVWTEDETPYDPDDDPSLPLTVQAHTLRVVDKFGNETWLSDSDDGVSDRRITITVGGSPLYLEYNP